MTPCGNRRRVNFSALLLWLVLVRLAFDDGGVSLSFVDLMVRRLVELFRFSPTPCSSFSSVVLSKLFSCSSSSEDEKISAGDFFALVVVVVVRRRLVLRDWSVDLGVELLVLVIDVEVEAWTPI